MKLLLLLLLIDVPYTLERVQYRYREKVSEERFLASSAELMRGFDEMKIAKAKRDKIETDHEAAFQKELIRVQRRVEILNRKLQRNQKVRVKDER